MQCPRWLDKWIFIEFRKHGWYDTERVIGSTEYCWEQYGAGKDGIWFRGRHRESCRRHWFVIRECIGTWQERCWYDGLSEAVKGYPCRSRQEEWCDDSWYKNYVRPDAADIGFGKEDRRGSKPHLRYRKPDKSPFTQRFHRSCKGRRSRKRLCGCCRGNRKPGTAVRWIRTDHQRHCRRTRGQFWQADIHHEEDVRYVNRAGRSF